MAKVKASAATEAIGRRCLARRTDAFGTTSAASSDFMSGKRSSGLAANPRSSARTSERATLGTTQGPATIDS